MNAPASRYAARGRVLMLASALFFIANVLLVRAIGTHFAVDTWMLSSVRFLIGLGLVFLPLMPGGAVNLRSLWRNPLVIARGVIGGSAVAIFYATIPELGAGRATFVNNTYILWGALLAALFLREHLQARMVVALLLGLLGVGLLTGVSAHGWAFSRADALAILGAVFSAIVIVIIRRLREHETIATIFGSQCAWGLAFTAVPTVTGWQTPGWLAAALLALAGLLAGAGQLFMTAGYRWLPVAEGSLLQMSVPVGIALGGVVFFQERYSLAELIGASLIIGSCVLGAMTRPRIAGALPKDFQR
ncbi:MAG: DMT family transporter [Opitutaceae bacterium]|nr:DMT family transporter [Opitutaceae bacterium]